MNSYALLKVRNDFGSYICFSLHNVDGVKNSVCIGGGGMQEGIRGGNVRGSAVCMEFLKDCKFEWAEVA